MTNINPTDIKCVVVKFEGTGSCKYIDKFLDIYIYIYINSFISFITRPLPYGRDAIFEYISCIMLWTQYAIVQKGDIFVLHAKGRIALLRHCLCEMILSSFRSDPAPIVLPTTKVTMKK